MGYSRRDFLRQTTVTLAMTALAARALPGAALAETTPDFAQFIDASGEELILGGRPLSWWIESFGLPFHVSYAPDIRANLLAFKEVFARLYPKGEVRYAGKASTHPAIFRLAAEAGVGIDVASPYETRCALEAGVPPDRLDLNGNAKDDGLLNLAIGKDMLIIIDSIAELERVAALAKAQQRRPRALLRVTGFSLEGVTSAAIFTAGEWSKFGIALSDIPALLPRLADMPVKIIGFHTHIGSQINDLGAYQLVLGKMLELGQALQAAGHTFEAVNIGGGFPVSYVTQDEWDEILDRIRDGFIAAKAGDPSKIYLWANAPGDFVMGPDGRPTKEWKGELFTARYPKEKMLEALLTGDLTVNGSAMKATAALEAAGTPVLMVEPGRSIVSDSGITLARVAFDKKIAGTHDLISLDLGVVNYCEAIVALPARQWALATDPKRRDAEPFESFIAGNLCFSADMLSRLKVAFPRRPVRGDVLLISSTGAYNPTFFASNANSFPRPARILLEANGDWTYLKRADSYREIFSLDHSEQP
jgi:diaminopimelate decarboxylase